MNIFKIGLLFTVLIFNLSCSILPKNPSQCPLVQEDTQDEHLTFDGNVAEASFIDYTPNTNTDFNQLISYLDQKGIHDEASLENIDQLLAEINFSADQLKTFETEIEESTTNKIQKDFLQSLVVRLQKEVND